MSHEKQPYTPPKLETHQTFVFITGTSLPIGTVIDPTNLDAVLQNNLEIT